MNFICDKEVPKRGKVTIVYFYFHESEIVPPNTVHAADMFLGCLVVRNLVDSTIKMNVKNVLSWETSS